MPYSQATDPFFAMLRRVRALRERDGVKPDAEAAQATVRQLHDDAAEEIAEVARHQEERWQLREARNQEKEQVG